MATEPEPTANEAFLAALLRHQIGLLRLSASVRNDIFALLDATEEDIAEKIRTRLALNQGLSTPADVRRLNALLIEIRAPRLNALNEVTRLWMKEMTAIALAEPGFTSAALRTVSPVQLSPALPSPELLSSIVRERPFEGQVLRKWAKQFTATDIRRIEQQIRIGLVQGEGSDAIARRVVGTKRQKGRDGITEVSRREAAAITRTAVNHVTNQARSEFYLANAELFTEELYVSTLDSVTTPDCRRFDGLTFPLGVGPMPPRHFNCRSLRVAIIDGMVLGQRQARQFTQQRLLREFAEQQGIRPVKDRKRLPRGTKGKFDTFSRKRIRELTGRVPAKTTYTQWLNGQSAQFQDDILGPTRGALFRKGGLKLDKFVNRAGDQLTLKDLASKERSAFIAAGLDPEDFL